MTITEISEIRHQRTSLPLIQPVMSRRAERLGQAEVITNAFRCLNEDDAVNSSPLDSSRFSLFLEEDEEESSMIDQLIDVAELFESEEKDDLASSEIFNLIIALCADERLIESLDVEQELKSLIEEKKEQILKLMVDPITRQWLEDPVTLKEESGRALLLPVCTGLTASLVASVAGRMIVSRSTWALYGRYKGMEQDMQVKPKPAVLAFISWAKTFFSEEIKARRIPSWTLETAFASQRLRKQGLSLFDEAIRSALERERNKSEVFVSSSESLKGGEDSSEKKMRINAIKQQAELKKQETVLFLQALDLEEEKFQKKLTLRDEDVSQARRQNNAMARKVDRMEIENRSLRSDLNSLRIRVKEARNRADEIVRKAYDDAHAEHRRRTKNSVGYRRKFSDKRGIGGYHEFR